MNSPAREKTTFIILVGLICFFCFGLVVRSVESGGLDGHDGAIFTWQDSTAGITYFGTPTATPTATPPFPSCPVTPTTVFYTDFDNLTVPMLPAGASAVNEVDPDGVFWQSSNAGLPSPPFSSAPNSLWVNAPELRSDKYLYLSGYSGFEESWIELRFTQNFDFESGFDGGVLELWSQFTPTWRDIRDAGGFFVMSGYNSTISSGTDSPITGRAAWSGNSGGFVTTIVRLPSLWMSRLRWRVATDTGQSGHGWRIDNVRITSCNVPGGTPTGTPTATPAVSPSPPITPTPTFSPTPTIIPTPTLSPTPMCPIFTERFDLADAPALPPKWTAANSVGPAPLWITLRGRWDTFPNSLSVDDPAVISDKSIASPGIAINSANARLSFRHNFNLEFSNGVYRDGGVLEVSSPNINSGAFTDITDPAVGGTFVTGGYSGTITIEGGNPLSGRMAWSGNSGGYISTVVDLGANVSNQTIKLRFRMGSGESGSGEGWMVDSVVVLGTCSPPPTPTPTATPTPSPTPFYPVTVAFNGTGVGAIPDGGPLAPPDYGTPLIVSFNVSNVPPGVFQIGLYVTLTHPSAGDVDMVLTSPVGASVTVASRIGVTMPDSFGSTSDFSGDYRFFDTSSLPNIWSAASTSPIPFGYYRATAGGGPGQTDPPPFTSLNSLISNPVNGTWTLRVRDAAQDNIGVVYAARLVLTHFVPSGSPTATPTPTPMLTPTITPTPTLSPTPIATPSNTPTATPTASPTFPPCETTPGTALLANFDDVAVPTLPGLWAASNGVDPDGVLWQTSNAGEPSPPFYSPPNSAWVNAPEFRSDKYLISPPFSGGKVYWRQLRFAHNFDFENGFDGGVLEYANYSPTPIFSDIEAAGGVFVAGGYDSTISSGTDSPIAGRAAWSGHSGGYQTTIVNLPGDFGGILRWRMATDTGQSGAGWRIDNVTVTRCYRPSGTPTSTPTSTPTPSLTPPLTPTPTATPTPRPRAFDYDGDRRSDISVFRPSDGNWYLQRSMTGFYGLNFGLAEDRIEPADYDGDGKTDIAVYRPSTRMWYILNSSNSTILYYHFGLSDDVPTPGDYDGDRRADISVFRPSNWTWYRLNSSNGAFVQRVFGDPPSGRPVVGDYDGDGKADLATFNTSTGVWRGILSSNNGLFLGQFGLGTDKVVPADYDGDHKTDLAVFRPSEGQWYIRHSATSAYTSYNFGLADDIPVPADFDGDGKADIAVFRPSDGTWYIINSSNNSYTIYQFGQNGDRPTQSAYGN